MNLKLNEWNLLREQFHALMHENSGSIEDILDVQFRRRFSELINEVAERANRTEPNARNRSRKRAP
jgi:hypothetical protein